MSVGRDLHSGAVTLMFPNKSSHKGIATNKCPQSLLFYCLTPRWDTAVHIL